ncbi:MAG: hypothetical protein H0Z22_07160 [Thermosipho sp. (in: Bacteria)]|nr:hypothetical protein [Thermosipho sp. (in: thermotogales)]
MRYDSPLFQSALELFAHAIEHFNRGDEKDRKFVILHLANAVELILKDFLLDLGESIYRNPKETVNIWEAIRKLQEKESKEEKIIIPSTNKIEILIDERNALQHRYGFPNEITTIFHMDNTYNFLKEFLRENYGLEIDEVIKDFFPEEEFASFQLRRKISTENELDKLIKLAKIHPVGALLSAFAYLESQLLEIRDIIMENSRSQGLLEENREVLRDIRFLTMKLMRFEYLPKLMRIYEIPVTEEVEEMLFKLRDIKNSVSQGREQITQKEAKELIEFIKSIEPKVKELKEKVKMDPNLILNSEKIRRRTI